MKLRPKTAISEYFSKIKDPRVERRKLHKLIDIITITICAVVSGVEHWTEIQAYGEAKYKWFKKFLELPNGIPSHDTFSSEIIAIPSLLQKLKLKGCIVTIDAMGCQKKIVEQIVEQGADYLIALKKNQAGLYEASQELFIKALAYNNSGLDYQDYYENDLSHGREETRAITVLNKIEHLVDTTQWKNLKSIIKVDSLRVDHKGKMEFKQRYFISSLVLDAKSFAEIIRTHGRIENQLNWVLDVQFNEDDSRIRKENSPENMAIIRQLALSLLNQDTTSKKSVKSKQNKASWDNDYLLQILTA